MSSNGLSQQENLERRKAAARRARDYRKSTYGIAMEHFMASPFSDPGILARYKFIIACRRVVREYPELDYISTVTTFGIATSTRMPPFHMSTKAVAGSLDREGVQHFVKLIKAIPQAECRWSVAGVRVIWTDQTGRYELFPYISKGRKAIPKEVRLRVLSIGYCLLCGSKDRLSVDHIKPYSLGGSDDESNLQCLCMPCNIRKRAKYEPSV